MKEVGKWAVALVVTLVLFMAAYDKLWGDGSHTKRL
jgi:hypothetical protein